LKFMNTAGRIHQKSVKIQGIMNLKFVKHVGRILTKFVKSAGRIHSKFIKIQGIMNLKFVKHVGRILTKFIKVQEEYTRNL